MVQSNVSNFQHVYLTIDRILTDTNTQVQGEPGCNGDEGVLHTPNISRIGVPPSGAV